MMKKKRVVKILAGTAVAALCVTGAVNYWAFNTADIVGTAEIGAYAAGTNEKDWKTANDSFTIAGEAVKQAAKETAAEKDAAAESAEETKTAQAAQTAQTNQTAQNTQTAQSAQSAETVPAHPVESAPAQVTESTPTPAPAQPAETPAPAPQYCGYCSAVFYSETEVFAHIDAVHFAPAPAPAPAPEPQYVEVSACQCECGVLFYSDAELADHQFSYAFGEGHDYFNVVIVKVPA